MPLRSLLRTLGAVTIAATALGACGDDDAEGADPETSSSTTSPATTTPPATSTTLAAADRTLIVSYQGLLGWWEDGRWVQSRAGEPTPAVGGEEYTVVRLEGPTSAATGAAATEPQEFCRGPQLALEPPLPDPTGGVEHLDPVAVHGVTEPRPRPATLLDTGSRVYRDAAKEVLAGLGIDAPDPELAQVVRADLSGDGTDEVLVVAERLADPSSAIAEPGDYSVLFLRQVVDGEVRTTVVSEHRNEGTAEAPSPYLLVFRVSAIADLNGDGVMEVVTEEAYYEGAATVVHALAPEGRLHQVMAAGCGV